MKCANKSAKKKIIVIKYENVNTKETKQDYETRLYLKLMLNKLNVEQTKCNEGFYFYLYPFNTMWENFHDDFHMSTNQRTFLKTFLIVSEL